MSASPGAATSTTTRRSAWGVADQAVSSISNMLVLILVARTVGPAEFGAFAIALEVYLVIVFIGRGMSSDVLATAHAADAPGDLDRAARAGMAVMLGAGSGLGLAVGATGLVLGGVLGQNLAVLALVLPGLLVQDFVRYVFLVRGRPTGALGVDGLWFLLEIPVLLAASRAEQHGVVMLALWGGCGLVAGVVGMIWTGLVPARPGPAVAWLIRHIRLWPYFLLENLVFRATILVVMVGLTVTAGLGGVAGLRAATAIFAPVSVLGRGVVVVALPELARRSGDPVSVRRGVRRMAWLLTPLPLLLAAVLIVAPDRVGEELFGASWALASPLLLLTAISAACAMYAAAIAVGLRALQAGRAGLRARIIVALLALVAALVGGWADGEYGAALALAISSPFQAAVWWWQLRRAGSPRTVQSLEGQAGPDLREGES